MIFEIYNSRTNVVGADKFFLHVLDEELRYPAVETAEWQGSERPTMGWDGWTRLFRQPKLLPPWFPSGLLSLATRLAWKYNYPVQFDDRRKRPPPDDVPEFGLEISLRDYQQEAKKQAIDIGFGVLDMPPRSGKTRTAISIVTELAQPTIWLAPTDRIVVQTVQAIDSFLGPGYAYQLKGSKEVQEASRRKVVVCTAATAVRLFDAFYSTRKCIVIDEWHHGASSSYRKIMKKCEHIFHRFGMTGTFFRSGTDAMAMHALLANTIFKITSEELLQMGYLVPVHAAFIPVLGKKLRLDRSNPLAHTFVSGHGKYGIYEHTYRNQLVAHAAYTLAHAGYRVLVLIGTKKHGRTIKKLIDDLLPSVKLGTQLNRVEFISTDMRRDRQQVVIDSFNDRGHVQILIGTTILGEGVDLPVADALVLARGQQAEVALTQAMYRVSTAAPGKKRTVLVDFADRHYGKLLKHSFSRLRTYYDEPTFSVEVLPGPQFFPTWIKKIEESTENG